MGMIRLGFFGIFAVLFGQLYAGDFVGRVMVNYNVYTVFEGGRFEMSCSATHEDKRPELQWYFVDDAIRTNLTRFSSGGRGNTATLRYVDSNAQIGDTGDYFCFAMVGENEEDQKTSHGVPIQVIKEDNKPRVRITKKKVKGKIVLSCEVHPLGIGFLTWRHEGYRVKYDQLVAKLDLEPPSGGEYECLGNLTLGGYKYFISRAYATATASWSYTTSHTSFIVSLLFCIIAFLIM